MIEKDISKIIKEQEKADLYTAIIDALNKQMPRPVDRIRTICTGAPVCDLCKCIVHKTAKYCPNCGQKIDWGNPKWI